MKDCESAEDLIVAYLTSSLPEHEVRRLRDHVARCAPCAAHLRETARAVDLLPYSLPLTAPPPELRRRIMEQVLGAGAASDKADAAGRRREPGRKGTSRWRVPGAAAAVVLVLVAHALFLRQTIQDSRLLRRELLQARREIAAAATVLGEGAVESRWVLPMDKGSGFPRAWGHATLYDTRYGDVLVLAVGGLPGPRRGETYRAWLWPHGRPTDPAEPGVPSGSVPAPAPRPGGAMHPDEAGYASLIVQLERFHYRALSITREPDGRSTPVPRGPDVLYVTVPPPPPDRARAAPPAASSSGDCGSRCTP